LASKATFLVNPASANGATGRRWPKLEARARELGLHGETLYSQRPGQLSELAREAAGNGSLLVVVGGDGTLNEVVNGIAGAGAEIAFVAAGTGQDFGRTHGIPTRFDDAIRVALDGTARAVDIGRVVFRAAGGGEATRYFANVGSAGMSGAVAKRANSMSKALGGRATFYYALVREFAVWRNSEVTVRFDDSERTGRMHDVIVANGRWHGGGMKLAPDAEPDDGLFDVVLIGDITKLDFVTTSPKLYRGGHVRHPRVEVVRSATVSIEGPTPLPLELDGEQDGTTPARFEVVRAGLRVRAPR
jgi:diacylglycerol kinase (ATP)